ncbi:MAG: Rieske 2Fe-2S domain-containing protein [Peptoniphilaceae bacterium]
MRTALFRDKNSKIHCVEDICAHRGAKLSKGEIKNTNLTFKFPKQ